jgi:hypothetical protein
MESVNYSLPKEPSIVSQGVISRAISSFANVAKSTTVFFSVMGLGICWFDLHGMSMISPDSVTDNLCSIKAPYFMSPLIDLKSVPDLRAGGDISRFCESAEYQAKGVLALEKLAIPVILVGGTIAYLMLNRIERLAVEKNASSLEKRVCALETRVSQLEKKA